MSDSFSPVVPKFDIFRVNRERQPLWIEAVSSLDEARSRVHQLAESDSTDDSDSPEYFVYNQATGSRIPLSTPPEN